MQRVLLRWFQLDGGEIAIPGQIQTADQLRLVVWFDRTTPGYDARSMLREGGEVWLNIQAEGFVHVLPARVATRRLADLVILSPVGDAWQDQRRHYVRVSVDDLPPMAAAVIDADNKPTESCLVTVLDLSGGGVRFETTQPIARGDRLELVLEIDAGQPIRAVVEVLDAFDVRGGVKIPGLPPKFLARGHFTAVHERDRKRIIAYVFRQQPARRKLPTG